MRQATGIFAALLMLLTGSGLSAIAAWAGSAGLGADSSLHQQISLRNDSIRSGRLHVGGGLSGGK